MLSCSDSSELISTGLGSHPRFMAGAGVASSDTSIVVAQDDTHVSLVPC